MDNRPEPRTREELLSELGRLQANLCDLEEVHAFTLGKTSVHMSAEKAHNMQLEFEEERRSYAGRIAEIEESLKESDPIQPVPGPAKSREVNSDAGS